MRGVWRVWNLHDSSAEPDDFLAKLDDFLARLHGSAMGEVRLRQREFRGTKFVVTRETWEGDELNVSWHVKDLLRELLGNIHRPEYRRRHVNVSRRSFNVKFSAHPPPRLSPFSPLFVRRKLPVLFGRKIQSRFPSICRLAEASQPSRLLLSLLPLCFFSFFFILSHSFGVPHPFLYIRLDYIRKNVSGYMAMEDKR